MAEFWAQPEGAGRFSRRSVLVAHLHKQISLLAPLRCNSAAAFATLETGTDPNN